MNVQHEMPIIGPKWDRLIEPIDPGPGVVVVCCPATVTAAIKRCGDIPAMVVVTMTPVDELRRTGGSILSTFGKN